jgi:hypothetical protein
VRYPSHMSTGTTSSLRSRMCVTNPCRLSMTSLASHVGAAYDPTPVKVPSPPQ